MHWILAGRSSVTFTWVDARYFDGLSAQRRQVFVSLDVESQRLTIHDHLGADLDIWPLETLRQMRDDAGAGMVLPIAPIHPQGIPVDRGR